MRLAPDLDPAARGAPLDGPPDALDLGRARPERLGAPGRLAGGDELAGPQEAAVGLREDRVRARAARGRGEVVGARHAPELLVDERGRAARGLERGIARGGVADRGGVVALESPLGLGKGVVRAEVTQGALDGLGTRAPAQAEVVLERARGALGLAVVEVGGVELEGPLEEGDGDGLARVDREVLTSGALDELLEGGLEAVSEREEADRVGDRAHLSVRERGRVARGGMETELLESLGEAPSLCSDEFFVDWVKRHVVMDAVRTVGCENPHHGMALFSFEARTLQWFSTTPTDGRLN